jgi:cytochrome P450
MASAATTADEGSAQNIVYEIMNSSMPASEKRFERIFDEVGTVTGAGFETTASVLRLIIYHIFSNADILQRLRAELASVDAGSSGKIELRALERLPYLTSVLMEGLRLSPAIATRSSRISVEKDIVFGEWSIPQGTPVGMTTLLMHLDKNIYEDPMRFDPDRWMDKDFRKRVDKTYAPFSRGTRICIGMQ